MADDFFVKFNQKLAGPVVPAAIEVAPAKPGKGIPPLWWVAIAAIAAVLIYWVLASTGLLR